MSIHIISAISRNNCIGDNGQLPWHIPEDLARFKELTISHTVIMGRRTWESLPERYRPLPDRTNIVISRDTSYSVPEGVHLTDNLEEMLLNHEGKLFIIGGGEIYREALPHADTLEITHVHDHVEGDTFFPIIDPTLWRETTRDDRTDFSFVSYEKIIQKRGKLIVLYGINNLGKSTQAKLLVERIRVAGHPAEYMKYPIYNLAPSGPIINSYLREGNPLQLTPREIQVMYTLNRDQGQERIANKIKSGINIVAEDYTGTGIAWGTGKGVDRDFLELINSHLLPEDIVFLFDGDRFLEAKESTHKHETDDSLTARVREIHRELGEEKGWIRINANRPIDEIIEELWHHVEPIL
jgi:dihydrofolate reductase